MKVVRLGYFLKKYWLGRNIIGLELEETNIFAVSSKPQYFFLALIQSWHQVVYMGSIGVNASNLSAQGLFAFVHEWENR